MMTIEDYKEDKAKAELYDAIKEGLEDVAEGRVRPFYEAIRDIKRKDRKASDGVTE